jgi:DNA-directed RNA polymerase alpha subunit
MSPDEQQAQQQPEVSDYQHAYQHTADTSANTHSTASNAPVPTVQEWLLEDVPDTTENITTDIITYDFPIQLLNMSGRTTNSLLRADITTIGQLASKSDADLLHMRNFGAKSLREVRDTLATVNIATLRPATVRSSSSIRFSNASVLSIAHTLYFPKPLYKSNRSRYLDNP